MHIHIFPISITVNFIVVTSLYHFVINIKTTCGTDFRFIFYQSKNKGLKYEFPQGNKKQTFYRVIRTNETNALASLVSLDLPRYP